MAKPEIEAVRRMFDAFNRGDVEAVLEAFDPECVLNEPAEVPDRPTAGFRGREGIRAWMRNLRDTGGVQFEPRRFERRDEVILVELASRGRGQASGVPIPEWSTFAVIRLRDGKIARVDGFLDRDEAVEAALGRGQPGC